MERTCMKTLHSTANIGELGLFFKGQVHSKMADFFLFAKKYYTKVGYSPKFQPPKS